MIIEDYLHHRQSLYEKIQYRKNSLWKVSFSVSAAAKIQQKNSRDYLVNYISFHCKIFR